MKTFLEWLERVLAVFGFGFKMGQAFTATKEAERDKALLQLQLRQNEIENEQNFSGRSDDDIVRDFFGGKFKR